MKPKKILVYLYTFAVIFDLSAQISLDKKLFKEAAKTLLIKEIIKLNSDSVTDHIRSRYNSENTLHLTDTSSIDIIVPIFILRKSEKSDYLSLNSLIDFTTNQYMQWAFLENINNYYAMHIIKGIRDERTEQLYKGEYSILPQDDALYWRPKFDEKYFSYFEFKKYININPSVQLFTIFRINGLWGIKNGKLIRLTFNKQKDIVEIDGEEYYRKVLLKNGLSGINRVIEGGFFEQFEYK